MRRIGEKILTRDELGGRLADAMRLRAGKPERVTMDSSAPRCGTARPRSTTRHRHWWSSSRPLRVPDWVDWELLAGGAKAYRRFGQNAADILVVLLVDRRLPVRRADRPAGRHRRAQRRRDRAAAGRDAEVDRLALGPDALRPGGEAWRLTLHVRAMHALVNQRFTPGWDVERWGLPINQADQAATLGLFDAVVLLGVRALGVPVSRADSRAVMHLWRYVGWLMGVDEDLLVDSERERHRVNYHLLLAQADISEAGRCSQGDRGRAARPGLRPVRAAARLGGPRTAAQPDDGAPRPAEHGELGLPLRPPWVVGYLLPLNALRYQVAGRLPGGRERLERWGVRPSERILARHYGEHPREIGALP